MIGSPKSIYRPISKEAVAAEYAEASERPSDFEKVKWGSEESMRNRFRLALDVIEWQSVSSWLDVGCGTGAFFTTVEAAGHRFRRLVGVDITDELLVQAGRASYSSPAAFVPADLEDMPPDLRGFDLVTLVGVLQQCGAPPERALSACVDRLGPGGQLYLTTKNIGWNAFADAGLAPEEGHSWFDYGELADILVSMGVEIDECSGLLPREGRRVPLDESHTLYLVGTRLP